MTDGLGGLLPCANCGGTATLQQQKFDGEEGGGFFIECGNPQCRMTTPLKFACMDDVEPLLAEIWNRRVSPAFGPDNPPRLRKPGESLDEYRSAMGWSKTPNSDPGRPVKPHRSGGGHWVGKLP